MSVYKGDIHETPFSDDSFDTVIDTFGLECCYDLDRAIAEIKRVTKKGGKILLLERGRGVWMEDNLELLRKASLNLGARGQIYHHDFAAMLENDPDLKVIEKKRKHRGMLYFYILEK